MPDCNISDVRKFARHFNSRIIRNFDARVEEQLPLGARHLVAEPVQSPSVLLRLPLLQSGLANRGEFVRAPVSDKELLVVQFSSVTSEDLLRFGLHLRVQPVDGDN